MAENRSRWGIYLACALLSACGGGGGGGGDGSGAAPPAPVPTKVSVKVVDGALSNAVVFLDKNNNGVLDTGESTARTNSAGVAILDVVTEDVGKSPVVALVGTDAVDADSGPVTVAYVLRAPADSTAVVSPLTTIVQRIVDDSGVSTAQAEAAAKAQTDLGVSMLADFTADNTSAGKAAAIALRLVVVAIQQQTVALAAAAGNTDLSGASITLADIGKAIQQSMVQLFPSLVQSAQGSAVQTACASIGSAGCTGALQTEATGINASGGLTVASLPVVVAGSRNPDAAPPANAPITAGASLSFLNYGDVNNWYYRVFVSTAAENTPDAQGLTRFRSIYRANSGGTLYEWGSSPSYARRDDTHWNGSAWVTCPLGFQMTQTPRDANGRVANTNYCDGLEISSSQRSSLDITGKTLAEIASAIRSSLPNYASWGSAPAGYTGNGTPNYGTAVFPEGSRLLFQTTTRTATAFAYDVTSPLFRYSPEVTAGGDTRIDGATSCNTPEANANPTIGSTSLEDMVANFKGTPCIYASGSMVSSASPTPLQANVPNEWWGNSTLSIGILGEASLVPNPTTYYTTNTLLRLAFPGGGGNPVVYYSCLQRQINGSPRNCSAIGTGSYVVETLGDARVLRLLNPPAQAASLDYERIFVERGAKVYFGYRSKNGVSNSTRLNLLAANAMLTQLGIPPITP